MDFPTASQTPAHQLTVPGDSAGSPQRPSIAQDVTVVCAAGMGIFAMAAAAVIIGTHIHPGPLPPLARWVFRFVPPTLIAVGVVGALVDRRRTYPRNLLAASSLLSLAHGVAAMAGADAVLIRIVFGCAMLGGSAYWFLVARRAAPAPALPDAPSRPVIPDISSRGDR